MDRCGPFDGRDGGTAQAQTALKAIVFPGLSNLMQIVAQANGYYAKRGLAVELVPTPNSTELRNGLAEGRYHIAHAATDIAVAQVETAKVDLFVFTGGNNGNNSLFVRPEINSYEDIRGKTVVVDAPNTAFALLLYKMLQEKGLQKGDYKINPVGGTDARLKTMTTDPNAVAGMLSPPQNVSGERAGLKNMGPRSRWSAPTNRTPGGCCAPGARPIPIRWCATSRPTSKASDGP
jgi:ABC-type nitrate/sulfonate/bicarbonate transport system substrate-binding protein